MRLFAAIELSEAWKRAAGAAVAALDAPARDVRWVALPQMHVTLKFFGEVDVAGADELAAAVRAISARVPPFSLTAAEAGVFPARGPARVLWYGLDDPAGGCQAWLDASAARLAGLGFAPESRSFQPHVTLARSKSAKGGKLLAQFAAELPTLSVEAEDVREVVLFRSHLSAEGARYEALARAELKGC